MLLFSSFAYIGVFLLLILSGFGFPLPEEVTLLMAGFLTSQSIAHTVPMLFFCFTGAFISDMIPYFAGYFYGPRLLAAGYVRMLVNQRRMRKISLFFKMYGYHKVFLLRPFLLGIRPFVMLFAGTSGIKLRTFLPYQLSGIALGTVFWLFAGRLFASKIELLTAVFYRSKNVIIIFVLLGVFAYILCRFALKVKINPRLFIKAASVTVTALVLALAGCEVYVYRSGLKKLIQNAARRGRNVKAPPSGAGMTEKDQTAGRDEAGENVGRPLFLK
jgi:membrane protein DedA with SNARE-associated domain